MEVRNGGSSYGNLNILNREWAGESVRFCVSEVLPLFILER